MGLEEGVLDVPSYLDMIKVPPGQPPPPMDVLRWWFTLNYEAIVASADRDAFELHGQGVKVLSENEMLTEAGQRVHTGNSDTLNQQFAQNFTKHFAELAVKYPIYAELQNLCDLSLVGAAAQRKSAGQGSLASVVFRRSAAISGAIGHRAENGGDSDQSPRGQQSEYHRWRERRRADRPRFAGEADCDQDRQLRPIESRPLQSGAEKG